MITRVPLDACPISKKVSNKAGGRDHHRTASGRRELSGYEWSHRPTYDVRLRRLQLGFAETVVSSTWKLVVREALVAAVLVAEAVTTGDEFCWAKAGNWQTINAKAMKARTCVARMRELLLFGLWTQLIISRATHGCLKIYRRQIMKLSLAWLLLAFMTFTLWSVSVFSQGTRIVFQSKTQCKSGGGIMSFPIRNFRFQFRDSRSENDLAQPALRRTSDCSRPAQRRREREFLYAKPA